MIKMRNWEIETMYVNLSDPTLRESEVLYPVKVLSARHKNLRLIKPYYEDFIKLRDELIMRYGNKDENGNFSVDSSNEPFKQEYNELLNIDHSELDTEIVKIPQSWLYDLKLVPKEFSLLFCMLTTDE